MTAPAAKPGLSARDRWLISLLPATLVAGGYYAVFQGGLDEALSRETDRLAAARSAPPPKADGLPPSLTKARAALVKSRADAAAREAAVAQLRADVARFRATAETATATARGSDDGAAVIEKVETIFARHGLFPLTGGDAAEAGEGGLRGVAPILGALQPRNAVESALNAEGVSPATAAVPVASRVWRLVFDGPQGRFRDALRDLVAEVPSAVPLAVNLVYNPDTDGQSRLLELWLLY
jgi:hypothetical protein